MEKSAVTAFLQALGEPVRYPDKREVYSGLFVFLWWDRSGWTMTNEPNKGLNLHLNPELPDTDSRWLLAFNILRLSSVKP